jgi:hypothetical protein
VNAIIEHPPGEETQWDWLDLPDPPASWGWGKMAHLLVGSLAHSSFPDGRSPALRIVSSATAARGGGSILPQPSKVVKL